MRPWKAAGPAVTLSSDFYRVPPAVAIARGLEIENTTDRVRWSKTLDTEFLFRPLLPVVE